MALPTSIAVVFAFFSRLSLRNRRTWLLSGAAFIPILVLLVARVVTAGRAGSAIGPVLFHQMAVPFLFTLYIPLMGLLGGSSCVGDEIDQRTLVFLTTRPVKKSAVLAGKAGVQAAISLAIVFPALLLSFAIGFGSFILSSEGLARLGKYLLAGGLATLAYTSLFVLLGTLMKKPVIAGIVYIFGWEYVVQFIPGSTQHLTISHYVKSLLPYKAAGEGFLMFQLEPSPALHAAMVLLILSAVFLVLATRVFSQKEYVLSEPRI
jgi:ABC-2 type transport system permease protein